MHGDDRWNMVMVEDTSQGKTPFLNSQMFLECSHDDMRLGDQQESMRNDCVSQGKVVYRANRGVTESEAPCKHAVCAGW